MATTYIDPASGFHAYALQARTNAAGSAVDDIAGKDYRTVLAAFTEGVVTSANAYQVVQDSPAAMRVVVGSGDAQTDVAYVAGRDVGQGMYTARLGSGTTNVTINAAHASNPRIDQVYLVIQDNAFDSSGRVLPRLAYRDGTPAGSPSAPGPDAGWDAYLLLASVLVPAAASSIVNANITDERVSARIVDNGVATGSIQDSAVTAGKIASAAVGTSQLVNSAVTSAKIADGAVSSGNIAATLMASRLAVASGVSNANLSLTTSFQAVFSTTFNKPGAWTTYTLLVFGSVYFNAGTGDGVPEARIRIGASTSDGLVAPGQTVDEATLNPVATFTGLSTASLPVAVEARHTGLGGSSQTKRSASLTYMAFMTS